MSYRKKYWNKPEPAQVSVQEKEDWLSKMNNQTNLKSQTVHDSRWCFGQNYKLYIAIPGNFQQQYNPKAYFRFM